MKLLLNETDEIGFAEPKSLLLGAEQIRSVESYRVLNGLSDTVSKITLKEPVTHFKGEDDVMYNDFIYYCVFETVNEIHQLIKGEKLERDCSLLRRSLSR